jgi:hypothetical protein
VRSFVERFTEPNDGDQTAGPFAAEPLHAAVLYCCRRRWLRVMKRHDYIRDALCCARHERIPGVRGGHARTEGGEPTGGRRRHDGATYVRVHKDGTTWVVDVAVCPGTTRYVGEGAATVLGTAAAVYEGVKMDKYNDQPNFVPFSVETGRRVDVAGRRFLDTLIGRLASEEAAEPAQDGAPGMELALKRVALQAVAWSLVKQQG